MLYFGFSVEFRTGDKQTHSLMKAKLHHADLLFYTSFSKATSPQTLTDVFQKYCPNLWY